MAKSVKDTSVPYLRFLNNKFKCMKASKKNEEIERIMRDINIVESFKDANIVEDFKSARGLFLPRLTNTMRIVRDVDNTLSLNTK